MTTKAKKMNLKDLLIQKLNALYDIESELIKTLPKLVRAATNQALKEGFRDHLKETKKQKQRLEEAHKLLGVRPKKLKAEAIRGLAKDGAWIIKNVKPATAMNANLARAAQYVEHYEMAGYMAAIDWAEDLGEREVVSLLEKNLKEEKQADQKLSFIGSKIDMAII